MITPTDSALCHFYFWLWVSCFPNLSSNDQRNALIYWWDYYFYSKTLQVLWSDPYYWWLLRAEVSWYSEPDHASLHVNSITGPPLLLLETVSRSASVVDHFPSHSHIQLCVFPLGLWLEKKGPTNLSKRIKDFNGKRKVPGMGLDLGWTRTKNRRWRTHPYPHAVFRISSKETWFWVDKSSGEPLWWRTTPCRSVSQSP